MVAVTVARVAAPAAIAAVAKSCTRDCGKGDGLILKLNFEPGRDQLNSRCAMIHTEVYRVYGGLSPLCGLDHGGELHGAVGGDSVRVRHYAG